MLTLAHQFKLGYKNCSRMKFIFRIDTMTLWEDYQQLKDQNNFNNNKIIKLYKMIVSSRMSTSYKKWRNWNKFKYYKDFNYWSTQYYTSNIKIEDSIKICLKLWRNTTIKKLKIKNFCWKVLKIKLGKKHIRWT